ncbi:hypothetical protein MNBD_GAMMA12-3409 [hydrothermal vent metagenome]|uniref:Uncharacterized protein n=1 Tax=hydrothermal vent metagenome TaxID=652676 RepID=A0A3B0YGL6_9ZZZZ
MIKKLLVLILTIVTLSATVMVSAGEVEIRKVVMQKTGSGWVFEVTLKHDDTGWKHYANAWRVLAEGGKVIKTRVLAHPHVNEQPFTRGLGGVLIPKGSKLVIVEARDTIHGWSKKRVLINLAKDKGEKYFIKR